MRILVGSNHRYPARRYPASAGGIASARVTDCLVKGLSELGHEVFYRLREGVEEPLPRGVTLASGTMWEEAVDVLHLQDVGLAETIDVPERPWVKTVHVDLKMRGLEHRLRDNWVFVSQTLARSYARNRYVLNGVDPSEYIYSETKSDYLLFMCSLDRAIEKGLEIALSLSEKIGFQLVIAGSASDSGVMERVRGMCRNKNVKLVGEARGERKAEWLAGAKALLFPTQLNEAFGLVMAEALMSGTPVICSNQGACPELISTQVGFICESLDDYARAISRIEEISPAACLDKAMSDFHYLKMAMGYVREYEKEIANYRMGQGKE